ncbi:DUF2164 domain-containing protein [Candidatus Bipolaricaulota bacterium]|nr:DUF2164 domain-containing protein [Candidatus Bipolaricaulota bacterium]
MSIELEKDVKTALIVAIKRYFQETMDQEIGDLKATLLLNFFLKTLAPAVYNHAVHDVQMRMQEIVSEIDGTCFEPEVPLSNTLK